VSEILNYVTLNHLARAHNAAVHCMVKPTTCDQWHALPVKIFCRL